MSLAGANLSAVREFVNLLKKNPTLIHDSQLNFFKSFLDEFKIPKQTDDEEPTSPTSPSKKAKKGKRKANDKPKAKGKKEKAKPKSKTEEPKVKEPEKEEKEDEEEEIPKTQEKPKPQEQAKGPKETKKETKEDAKMDVDEVEEEEKPQVEPDAIDEEKHRFPPEKEGLNDSEIEKSDQLKTDGREALRAGDYDKALDLLTKALNIQPNSSILIADRGKCWLKLKKPNNAIKDADRALGVNPDSAKALRIRGQARILLGQLESGHADLCTANRIDYDEETYDLIKQYQEKVDKIRASRIKRERSQEEKKKRRIN